MCSRLEGQRCIVTTPSVGLDVGTRFVVLGNAISVSIPREPGGFFFLELAKRSGKRNGVTGTRRTARDPVPSDATSTPQRSADALDGTLAAMRPATSQSL